MSAAADALGSRAFPTAEEAAATIRELATPGAWILLKGSRGIKLESILPRHD
jgi:UDP-N-acetylmuramyl pentapeptide synthase